MFLRNRLYVLSLTNKITNIDICRWNGTY